MTPEETAIDRVPSSDRRRPAPERIGEPESTSRRRLLDRLFYAALSVFGLSLVFPIRSLAPRMGPKLRTTGWRDGERLVGEDGTFLRSPHSRRARQSPYFRKVPWTTRARRPS